MVGYSEIHCHLCGVSSNIGRIRCPGEPWESSWPPYQTSVPGRYSLVNTISWQQCPHCLVSDGITARGHNDGGSESDFDYEADDEG